MRRVSHGDTDLIVHLFTEQLGLVGAVARGARKSQKRFGGALEPFHTVRVRLQERATGDLFVLEEAVLETVRTRLVMDLERMEAAGRALSWIRTSVPPQTPEPRAFSAITALLERLDSEVKEPPPDHHLAALGLTLLSTFGWGLDFTQCVRCGRPCGENQAAMVDADRGGLVCKSCGGARQKLGGAQRQRLLRASSGDGAALKPDDVPLVLSLVERAFAAHTGKLR